MLLSHQIFRRCVAVLMLLCFAALFGVGYGAASPMPLKMVVHQKTVGQGDTADFAQSHSAAGPVQAMTQPHVQAVGHGCCDGDMLGSGADDLRCSLECASYLAVTFWGLHTASPVFSNARVIMAFERAPPVFLRPPIGLSI